MPAVAVVVVWVVLLAVTNWAITGASLAQPAASPPTQAAGAGRVPDPDALPEDMHGRTVRFGRDLIAHTSVLIGPAAEPAKRYLQAGLDCASCHLQAGTQQFALPLVGVWKAYPAFSARLGKVETMAERINDCMERSMNGRRLPESGPEMTAILAYLEFIGTVPGSEKSPGERAVPELALLQRAASPEHGEKVYRSTCAPCHGADGAGVRLSPDEQHREQRLYLFPPLWGAESFNDGAGMARNIAAAWFVRTNMPKGVTFADPVLSPEDAYDVAAYVNRQPRPHKADLDKDYPDRWLKPADAAFPPLLGPFTPQQHALGPWPPIIEWLKAHSPSSHRAPLVD